MASTPQAPEALERQQSGRRRVSRPGPKAEGSASFVRSHKTPSDVFGHTPSMAVLPQGPTLPAQPVVAVRPPRQPLLPRQTEEQLLSLCLKYEGVTREKIPNLVADLNLSIPVDFDVGAYFSTSGGSSGGADQLILQPEDLMRFVVDLQCAVGHPNNVVLDTCQVLSAAGAAAAASAAAASTPLAAGSTYVADSVNISEYSGSVRASGVDYVERTIIEDTLRQFFPDEVNLTEITAHTVFQDDDDAPYGARAALQTQSSSAKLVRPRMPPPQQERQTVEHFQKFLASDSHAHVSLEAAFLRCGASDDVGYGLVLSRQALERITLDRQERRGMPTTFQDLSQLLDPIGTCGDVELATFEDVAQKQLQIAATRAAAAASHHHGARAAPSSKLIGGGGVASLSLLTDPAPTRDPVPPPPLACLLACVCPVVVTQLTNRATLEWILSYFDLGSHPSKVSTWGLNGGTTASSLVGGGLTKKVGVASAGGTNGDDTPRGTAASNDLNNSAGNNTYTTSRSETLDAMLDGIGGKGGRKLKTALPRYMARRGADDEITAAVKDRARQRRQSDRQRAETARTEQLLCGLAMAKRLNSLTSAKSPQYRRSVLERPPEELDIEAVLKSEPAIPKPPPSRPQSSRVGRLSEPKGFALLRNQRAPHEAVSSGGSLVEKYMIHYEKDAPRSSTDVTPIIEGALACPYPEGPLQKISPRMVALLADPYSIPPKRLHSAQGVRYTYNCVVDSWRQGTSSPRRQQRVSGDNDPPGE